MRKRPALTCVVEESGNKSAVFEKGVGGGDVLKVALLEQRVLKHHGLHLQVQKPEAGEETVNACLRKQHSARYS